MTDGFEVSILLSTALRIAIAYALALPIGWERESSTRSVGLRTFPLVSMASAAFALIGIHVFADTPDSQARLIAGLMTGIGFIGGGAILKGDSEVHGTSTAAGVWATGAIGTATAFDHYEIAIVVSLVTFVTFRWVTPIKERIEKKAGLKEGE